MLTRRRTAHALSWLLALTLIITTLVLAGCDSSDSGGEDTTRISGRVTDAQGYGKRTADLEGATVTAASIDASGAMHAAGGTATTDTEGHYALEVETSADVYVVQAEHEGITYRTLVYARGPSRVTAQPMTTESRVEADVYVEAKKDDEDEVTPADVAAYVDQRVAAAVDGGGTTTADVAATIRASVEAANAYLEEQEAAPSAEEVRDEKHDHFVELQSSLATVTSTSAEASALDTFEDALARIFVEAGASAETQAHARQAGHMAGVHLGVSGDDGFAVRRQSALLTAIATAHAVEAQMETTSATEASMDALAQARQTLVADLRTAASVEAMASAQADYDAAVQQELAATLNVSSSIIAAADAAVGSARASFESALQLAADAAAVADAYASFVTTAEASVMAQLNAGDEAEASATVLVLLNGAVQME